MWMGQHCYRARELPASTARSPFSLDWEKFPHLRIAKNLCVGRTPTLTLMPQILDSPTLRAWQPATPPPNLMQERFPHLRLGKLGKCREFSYTVWAGIPHPSIYNRRKKITLLKVRVANSFRLRVLSQMKPFPCRLPNRIALRSTLDSFQLLYDPKALPRWPKWNTLIRQYSQRLRQRQGWFSVDHRIWHRQWAMQTYLAEIHPIPQGSAQ